MNVPPSELAAVHLDRSDPYECVLENLRRARTLDEQKRVLQGWEAGIVRDGPKRPIKPDGPTTTRIVDEYVDDYILEGDAGYYSPNTRERFLIRDACHGLAPELLDSVREVDLRPDQQIIDEGRSGPPGSDLRSHIRSTEIPNE